MNISPLNGRGLLSSFPSKGMLNPISGQTNVTIKAQYDFYQGVTTVTPTRETQILHTEKTCLSKDIVVNPIPSNYGLITYNGSVITIT